MSMESPTCPPEMALVDFLDGRLGAADAERIEEHVARCSECRGVVDELSVRATNEIAPTAGGGTDDGLVREVLRRGASGGDTVSRAGTTLGRKYRLVSLLG